jgi:membrane dipeptidase
MWSNREDSITSEDVQQQEETMESHNARRDSEASEQELERERIRAESQRPRTISDASRSLLSSALTLDMTQPLEGGSFSTLRVPQQAREAGFALLSITMDFGVSGEDEPCMSGALQAIGAAQRFAAEHAEEFVYATELEHILEAKAGGKTALCANFQEIAALNGNLDLLRCYRGLGVTHMLLAYNKRNMAADGCSEVTDSGLSRFGRDLVREMRRAHILCDGSHTGYRSTLEAMELYEGPFIFSHSNCKAVFDHYRNLTDDQIKACAATGGVIGINGAGRFLDDPYARASSIFRHIDHIVQLVGSRHVGIGLDRMADPDGAWRWLLDNQRMWPANQGRPPQYATFAPHTAVGEVVDLMLAAGYPHDAIRGYLGENFMRVLREVWAR